MLIGVRRREEEQRKGTQVFCSSSKLEIYRIVYFLSISSTTTSQFRIISNKVQKVRTYLPNTQIFSRKIFYRGHQFHCFSYTWKNFSSQTAIMFGQLHMKRKLCKPTEYCFTNRVLSVNNLRCPESV